MGDTGDAMKLSAKFARQEREETRLARIARRRDDDARRRVRRAYVT
jgi:hypothetical protein